MEVCVVNVEAAFPQPFFSLFIAQFTIQPYITILYLDIFFSL